MDTETWVRFVLVMAGVAAVLGVVFGGGFAVARWARRRGRRPWLWVIGAYVAASIAWARRSARRGRLSDAPSLYFPAVTLPLQPLAYTWNVVASAF